MNNEELSKCYCEEVEGYMGARAYEGSNSGRHLYGSELSKAIRETLKKCGIKGVTVSCRGGNVDVVKVKFKLSNGDVRSWDECKDEMISYKENHIRRFALIVDPDTKEKVIATDYFDWSVEKQKRAVELLAKNSYERYIAGDGFGTVCYTSQIDKEEFPCFTDKFFERWDALGRVVNSFKYDNSNGMVDYYDTNFYQRFEIIAA